MSLLTDTQKGDLRVAILDELVAARAVAFAIEPILRRVKRSGMIDFEFSLQEAEHELAQLVALGLATVIADAVTRATHYQATPKGIIARE